MAKGSRIGSYQLKRGPASRVPSSPSRRLDRLNGNVALRTSLEQRLDGAPVGTVLHQDEVVRQQHAVVVEAFQAAAVHLRDAQTVPGDPDVAHEAFVPRTHQRLECAARPVGDLPLVLLDQVVQLNRVHAVDAEPDEGTLETCPSLVASPLGCLRRHEETIPVPANHDAMRSSESP